VIRKAGVVPISTLIDREKDLTVFTVTGSMTLDDQIAALKEFYDGEPTAKALWDFRKVAGKRLTFDEIDQLIAFVKRHGGKRTAGKTALLTATDVDFGVSRMSDAIADREKLPWKVRAFRSMDDAMKWLDKD
jgi:hypothetical protein